MRTGYAKEWNLWAVRWARQRAGIKLVAPDAPRRTPLPERYPDGRYSVGGAARLLGVSTNVVRRWLDQGLIPGERANYREHRHVWCLQIDETAARHLVHRARTTEV